jgi:hypothetical protein
MTLDEDLRRAFDALGDRLHAEVQHQIDAALAELRVAASTVQAAIPAQTAAAAVPVTAPTDGQADLDALHFALREMDDARSLTDVLDALLAASAPHAHGVAVLLRRGQRLDIWGALGLNGAPDAADAIRLPLTISGETIGELYADGGSPDALGILARHASRCLEAMTAFRTARALARQASAPPDEPANDDDASARRYAKLLVSEIKLYHESDVVAGRQARDLGTRLGGEIARARVLYDQRVPAQVRQRTDYFRDELIRTLADGDATLLEFHA